jgi:hypothetical protein
VRAAAALAGVLVLAAGLTPARAQPGAVPRDEPAPAPEPGGDTLPDYGPPPMARAAPAPGVPALDVPETPRFKLTYSRFTAHRLGGLDQPFNVPALTFYVLSSKLRVGATTRLGLDASGTSSSSDWFLDEVVSVGVQLTGLIDRVVPFVDFNAGFGFRMYATFNNSLPSFTWSFGVQAGAEIYLTRRLYLSAALGWIRPVVSVKTAASDLEPERILDVYSDTFIFTVGFGL